jgi:hypothetical protein
LVVIRTDPEDAHATEDAPAQACPEPADPPAARLGTQLAAAVAVVQAGAAGEALW